MDVLTREGKQEKNQPIVLKCLVEEVVAQDNGVPSKAFRSGLKVVAVLYQDLSSISGL